MKVSALKKGMVLKIASKDRCGWLTIDRPLSCGEPELRIGYKVMAALLHNLIPEGALIIYLGHDKIQTDPKDPDYRQIIRRVMINEKTAVIFGHNFRHFEAHPDFN
tara:strand:- start:2610 stop:2927 length:318 start_codon:yes stop_codon:yes gene_type:complete